MRKSTTEQVAENIGAALRTEEVRNLLADLMMEARFAACFRPIVREALADALDLDPEQIGPELVDEGIQQGITAGYLAKKWLEDRIPQMASQLRKDYGEQYEGFENEEIARQVARNFLVARDGDIVLANAVRDKLLSRKA